jgi:GNAT superfamily N-acetyltransferase
MVGWASVPGAIETHVSTSTTRISPGVTGVLDQRVVRDGARLTLRLASPADVDEVRQLYERLSIEDRHRRFHASLPGDRFLARWLTCDDAGLALVAEAHVPEGRREVVAEGGFRGGDGQDPEFAITVDPAWRGGLGTWLLEHLQGLARTRGHDRLAAHLFADNLPMRRLLERLGYVTIDRPDGESMRAIVATDDTTPTWPAGDRPRILVEADGGHWPDEQALRDEGHDVAVCPGPGGRRVPCPLTVGLACPLVEGADLVVTALRGADGERVRVIHEHRRASWPSWPRMGVDPGPASLLSRGGRGAPPPRR